jgi:hypothetical protein
MGLYEKLDGMMCGGDDIERVGMEQHGMEGTK